MHRFIYKYKILVIRGNGAQGNLILLFRDVYYVYYSLCEDL